MHCITCKCAQNDHCCRRAIKLHSFIHSFIEIVRNNKYEIQIISYYIYFSKKGYKISQKVVKFPTIPLFTGLKAHLGSRLHRSRDQSSVLESRRSLGSPRLPEPSFSAYESPPTANKRIYWWGFTTLLDGSRRILPPTGWGNQYSGLE